MNDNTIKITIPQHFIEEYAQANTEKEKKAVEIKAFNYVQNEYRKEIYNRQMAVIKSTIEREVK